MEFLENLDPVVGGGIAGALLLLVILLKWLTGNKNKEPDWVSQVRQLYKDGKYEKAGELQLRHGNVQEAFNLFEQGEAHKRAWPLAQRLGLTEKAAKHAEAAGEFEKAASFYKKIGQEDGVVRAFRKGGMFQKAAETIEAKGGTDPAEVGKAWEAVYADLLPPPNSQPSEAILERIQHAAAKAAQAYKRSGDRTRALHFAEAANRVGTGDVLAEPLPAEPVSQPFSTGERHAVATSNTFPKAPALRVQAPFDTGPQLTPRSGQGSGDFLPPLVDTGQGFPSPVEIPQAVGSLDELFTLPGDDPTDDKEEEEESILTLDSPLSIDPSSELTLQKETSTDDLRASFSGLAPQQAPPARVARSGGAAAGGAFKPPAFSPTDDKQTVVPQVSPRSLPFGVGPTPRQPIVTPTSRQPVVAPIPQQPAPYPSPASVQPRRIPKLGTPLKNPMVSQEETVKREAVLDQGGMDVMESFAAAGQLAAEGAAKHPEALAMADTVVPSVQPTPKPSPPLVTPPAPVAIAPSFAPPISRQFAVSPPPARGATPDTAVPPQQVAPPQRVASPQMELDPGMVSEMVKEVLEKVDEQIQSIVHTAPAPSQVVHHTAAPGTALPPSATRIEVVHIHDQKTNKSTEVRVDTDRYEVGDKLGQGGMAVVFKALDRNLGRDVALKFLPGDIADNPKIQKLFEKEAKNIAKLNHPNIVTIFDFGIMDERPYICMELIDGGSLAEVMKPARGQGLPFPQALDAAEGLLAALDYAHSQGIVHRDVKPANVMLTGMKIVKLMDFGIAKVLDKKHTTIVAGTPSYMAPEQMVGKGVDRRTDIFAAGVTIYEMLTGFLPFNGLRRDRPPIPLVTLRDSIPEPLDELILSCLELKKRKRPRSAGTIVSSLKVLRRQFESLASEGSSSDEISPSRPKIAQLKVDDVQGLLGQFEDPEDPEDQPADSVRSLFSAALMDERPEVRKSAIEQYPGLIDQEVSHSLLMMAMEDDEESIREMALSRLKEESPEDSFAGPLAAKIEKADLDAMSSKQRKGLFKTIVGLSGPDSVALLDGLFVESNEQAGQPSEEETLDEDHLSDLLSAVRDANTDVKEKLESAVHQWRSKRSAKKAPYDEETFDEFTDESISAGFEAVRVSVDSAPLSPPSDPFDLADETANGNDEDLPPHITKLLLDYLDVD